jgi:hypothetical protein
MDVEKFHKHKRNPDGLQNTCKKCHREYVNDYQARKRAEDPEGWAATQRERVAAANAKIAEWVKKNPELARLYRRARTHGLTNERMQELYDRAGGKCEICGDEVEDRKMHVDHCHTTGDVRGMLCQHCNTGLGKFRDSVQNLQNAIRYLSNTTKHFKRDRKRYHHRNTLKDTK